MIFTEHVLDSGAVPDGSTIDTLGWVQVQLGGEGAGYPIKSCQHDRIIQVYL
jgi:hypothetical protein